MGLCASQNEPSAEEKREADKARERTRAMDKELARSQNADRELKKLLFLGSGASGKSTLFKQLQTIYGKGFTEKERKDYTTVVYNNMLISIKTLIVQATAHYGGVSNEESRRVVLEAKEEDPVDLSLGPHMKIMWEGPGVQSAYEHRAKFHLNDSTDYYFLKIDEIMQPKYIPTEQDVFRSRVPTTGIVECVLEIDGNSLMILDVGGQKSERKKWIHCFDGVTAVLFVAALSAYDEVLYEDENTSRMVDSLDLFEEVTNSGWLCKTPTILFLNKKDLFADKLKKVPLKSHFPRFTGNTYDEAVSFVTELYVERHKQKKDIYIHVTCATDTANVGAVFTNVKDIIIKSALSLAGLV